MNAAENGADLVRKILPPRVSESHKGNYGTVLCLCGSTGYTGAAYLASSAAVRGGAGLVFLAVPESVYPILAVKTVEAMAFPVACDESGRITPESLPAVLGRLSGADVLVLGCGLGRSPGTEEAVHSLVAASPVPVVLDADGINAFENHIDKLSGRNLVLTPHEGELARLGFRRTLGESRASAALRCAEKFGAVVVFKGPGTAVAAPDGRLFVNSTGNPGMARGGSGDLLAGLTGAFIAQGADSFSAAAAAVYVHGLAGDLALQKYGEVGMTPGDMLALIPEALRLCRGR